MIRRYATLTDAGLSSPHAAAVGRLEGVARQALLSVDVPTDRPPALFYVPGRIEVLGKHTDYAGGRSLLCAVERGICLLAVPRDDEVVVAIDAASGSHARVAARPDAAAEGPAWRTYLATVVRRLARNFPGRRQGATLAFASDLPLAAGMSSSSALVTAFLLGLGDVSALGNDDEFRAHVRSTPDLATYASCIENGRDFGALAGDTGVGTLGGSEDHVAMLCARAGALSRFSFCPTVHEATVPLSQHWAFVVAASGVMAEKTGAAKDSYNRAARVTAALLAEWQAATGRLDATLGAAVRSAPGAVSRLREALNAPRTGEFSAGDLRARLDQFVSESEEIIPEVTALLASDRVAAIGPLVDRSQQGAEQGLGNQIPATTGLFQHARRLGAVAASAFGAGFGGSVWALVPAVDAAAFVTRWSEAYAEAFPAIAQGAQFLITRPGPAAFALEVGYTDRL